MVSNEHKGIGAHERPNDSGLTYLTRFIDNHDVKVFSNQKR